MRIMKKAELKEYLMEMFELVGDDKCFEQAHEEADKLLCKILKSVLPKNALIDNIITTYENVGKWYA